MPDTTRRRVLALAGAGISASVSGCATVATELADDRNSRATTPRTTRSNTRTRADREMSTDRPSQQATASDDAAWSTESVRIEAPELSLADVSIPGTDSRYARLGSEDAPVTATLYGNWKCPYTQAFVLTQLPEYVERYVRPGSLALEFRSVAYMDGDPFLGPDAPRAARSGLAVWDVDPDSYWQYFAYVFANQPQERHEWAQVDLLARFAEAAGVRGVDRIARSVRTGVYGGEVDATASAAAGRGVTTVPRLVLDGRGDVLAPTLSPEAVRAAVDARIREATQGRA